MYTRPSLEKYLTYTNSEPPRRPPLRAFQEPDLKFAVTISRQSGSGAHVVAEKLADYLHTHFSGSRDPWLIFDRNLAERVLEDNNLPKYLAKYMPEDQVSAITDAIDEMFGLHPPFWTLRQKTSETILHLAERGNVILIGRGANVITRKLGHVFHVRLVGSLEKRVEHIQEIYGIEKRKATELIAREDRGRRRYLRKYFGKEIDDPLLYDLVINTDAIGYENAARVIGESMLERTTALRLYE